VFAICTIAFLIKLGSPISGISAAAIWWLASRVKTPPELTQEHVVKVQGDVVPIFDQLMRGVARQSKLNALAAMLAAVAAILQVADAFMPTCWG
jgi:hypothetical protein